MWRSSLAAAVALPLVLSCAAEPTEPNNNSETHVEARASTTTMKARFVSPDFDPDDFVRVVDNRFFPLVPGTRFFYRGVEDGEAETNITIVTHDRKNILGISAVVVLDRVFVKGELKEKTFDWYAQDEDGNVWYLGEDTKEYENGRVVSTEGSWEAGRHGARPGIIMLAHPRVGDSYRQEFLAGEAEDQAKVVARDLDITVPYGSFHNCIRTVEFTRLEPMVKEAKLYCPRIGFVKARGVQGPETRLVLTHIRR
jgi:hypothetical protein